MVFFSSLSSIGYYNGYLYVSAENLTNQKNDMSIYKVSLDGTKREAIYNSNESMQRVVIHRGKCYVQEQAFDKEGTILTICVFSLDNPKEIKQLYKERYQNANINYMMCYEENCYFLVLDYSTGELVTYRRGINLEDGSISEYCKFATTPINIDKNGIYCRAATITDEGKYTWKNEYYYCGMDGKDKKVLTEKDFPAIARNATLYEVDEKYIYFLDINYGELAVPKEECRLYIYIYDGELEITIKASELGTTAKYCLGVGDDMIIKYMIDEDYVFYHVNKEIFCGEEVQLKEILRLNIDDMSPAFSVTYDK